MEKARQEKKRKSGGPSALVWFVLSFVAVLAGGLWTDLFAPLRPPLEPRTFLSWLFSPVERNAFMRLPAVQGDMFGIDASADGFIVAVGEKGLIVASADHGRSWYRGQIVDSRSTDAPAGGAASAPASSPANAPADQSPSPATNPRASEPASQPATPPANQRSVPRASVSEPSRANASRVARKWSLSFIQSAEAAVPASRDVRQQAPATDSKGAYPNADSNAPANAADSNSPRDAAAKSKAPDARIQQRADSKVPEARAQQDTSNSKAPDPRAQQDTSNSRAADGKPADTARPVTEGGDALTTEDGKRLTTEPPPASTPPVAHDLRGVVVVSSTVAIAVGTQGTIVRTEDAGKTWRRIPRLDAADIKVDLNAVTIHPRGDIVAVGQSGTFVAFDEPATGWAMSTSSPDVEFTSVVFANGDAGTILGRSVSSGTGITTRIVRESAKQWNRDSVINHGGLQLNAVAAADSGTFYAIGSKGASVSAPTDGDWSPKMPLTFPCESVVAVRFFDTTNGVAVCDDGTVLETNSTGASWQPLPERAPSGQHVALALDGKGALYAAGAGGAISMSSDRGRTWSTLTAHAAPLFASMAFGDSAHGIIVTGTGTVLTSDDAGATWTPASELSLEQVGAIAFADSQRAVVAGRSAGEPALFVTNDAGRRWTRATAESDTRSFTDVDFESAQHGYALDDTGRLWTTQDGGQSWTQDATKTRPVGTAIWINDRDHSTGVFAPADPAQAASQPGQPLSIPVSRQLERYQALIDGETVAVRLGNTTPDFYRMPRSAEQPHLLGGTFSPDWRHGILFGANGAAFASDGVEKPWRTINANIEMDIRRAHFVSDKRVVAMLGAGRVLTSDDAGTEWSEVKYHRYPSPWLWLAGAILFCASVTLFRRKATQPDVEEAAPSVTDSAVSDSPIGWKDTDALGLRPIATGLSRFLRNRRTQPPLTVAVTGEWGTGKSSLMNLLREDLQRFGFRPVWFNAWHHQSGENLLGSLLANIHAQGVPSLFSVAGIEFRAHLLLVRARRFWLRLAITAFVLFVLIFGYDIFGSGIVEVWKALTSTSDSGDPLTALSKAKGILGVLATLVPVIGALRAISAFGLQPGKLIAAVATTKQDESAKQTAGARYRFALEFQDFADALEPRTLVIFIDDLDRCRPQNVIDVLEAINFLVSSGKCVIVLGMARRWVEACVGQAFSELAAANADGNPAQKPAASAAENAELERQQFARNYLEKLINIEIRVPRVTEEASRAILETSAASEADLGVGRRVWGRLTSWAPAMGFAASIAAVVALAWLAAAGLRDWNANLESKPATTQSASAAPAVPSTPVAPADTTSATSRQSASQRHVAFDPSSAPVQGGGYWFIGGLSAAALAMLVIAALLARRELRTDDSPAFQEALAIMRPWILLGGQSPRSLKRFVNHLRYLAMRMRQAPEPSPRWDGIRARMATWVGMNPAPATSGQAASNTPQLEEYMLVALAAIYRCNENWLDQIIPYRAGRIDQLLLKDFADRLPDASERTRVAAALEKALAAFDEKFGQNVFSSDVFDRHAIVAFYAAMATDAAGPQVVVETAAPTSIRPVPTPAA